MESSREPPFTLDEIEKLREEHPTPFHIYDVSGIKQTLRGLEEAFSWVPEVNGKAYQNFFAVKALPNPCILEIMDGADCSSDPELILAHSVGLRGEDIMFTSNNTPASEFRRARKLGAVINLDDILHIPFLDRHVGMPELVCFRYNPGSLRQGNDIIGDPVEAKYGVRDDQIIDAYRTARNLGARRFGLHTMIVSNMRDEEYLIQTGRMLFDLVKRISRETGINFEFVNLGGGIGIPYSPDDKTVDVKAFGEGVRQAYEEKIAGTDLDPMRVVTESGRAITGPHGWLLTTVRHVMSKYREYVGVDACMANLMRPGMYGAYHGVTVLGKEDLPKDTVVDIVGSLCENNDKFAVQRTFPRLAPDDILAIHNCGAHAHAMGFNYNGKLRSSEFLFHEDRSFEQIRRAETNEDYFRTLDFPDSRYSHLSRPD